jgi:hypothetical protein
VIEKEPLAIFAAARNAERMLNVTHQDAVAHSSTVSEIPYQLQFVNLLIFLRPIGVQSAGSRPGRTGRKPRNNRPK